jgi:hypothetical protein
MTNFLAAARRVSVLIPAASATTARSATIDTAGANNAVVCVHVGAEANTNSTNVKVTLEEGDSTSSFATFNSEYVSATLDNTAAAVGTYSVPLAGRKRYLKLTMTPDTTTNGAVVSAAHVDFDDALRTQ